VASTCSRERRSPPPRDRTQRSSTASRAQAQPPKSAKSAALPMSAQAAARQRQRDAMSASAGRFQAARRAQSMSYAQFCAFCQTRAPPERVEHRRTADPAREADAPSIPCMSAVQTVSWTGSVQRRVSRSFAARCGTVNSAGRRFCAECGSPLALACPACGFTNEPGVKFCGGCGAALVATPAPPLARFAAAPETYTPSTSRRRS